VLQGAQEGGTPFDRPGRDARYVRVTLSRSLERMRRADHTVHFPIIIQPIE
jgi:hypothetical protein